MRGFIVKKYVFFIYIFFFILVVHSNLFVLAEHGDPVEMKENIAPLYIGEIIQDEEMQTPEDYYRLYITNINKIQNNTYFHYLNHYQDVSKPEDTIKFNAKEFTSKKFDEKEQVYVGSYMDKDQVLIIGKEEALIEYEVTVEKAGFYYINLEYIPYNVEDEMSQGRMEIELSLLINSQLPFRETSSVKLTRYWKNASEIKMDSNGNQYPPDQVENRMWRTAPLRDSDGIYNNASFQYFFQEGVNTISLFNIRELYALSSITLSPVQTLKTYETYYNEHLNTGASIYTGENILIEGEAADHKSDQTLRPVSDYSSPFTSPSSISKIQMNIIGQLPWQKPGQWVEWNVNVEKAGLYQISFRSKQSYKIGLNATRILYVNGEIPFEEASGITFAYSSNWKMKTFSNESNQPYFIYLNAGENQIRLEVAIGKFARTARNIDNLVLELNELYRRIIMVTTPNPDIYRNYDLDKEFIDLPILLRNYSQRLAAELEYVNSITENKSAGAAVIEKIKVQIDSFLKKPNTIPARIQDYKNNISSLSAWSRELRDQPLELDYLILSGENAKLPKADVGFFGRVWYELRLLFISFFVDYNVLGDVSNENVTLTLWVNWGRDQAQVLQNLIDNNFTPKHNINVQLKLVNASLVQGILSGDAPDVAVMVSRGQPVNMAMRGALLDLEQFEDFDEVVTNRYMPNATIPYEFNNGTYGLPDTEQFYMLFYRKDIFEQLEVEVPQTWDELIEVATVLQRNNLQVGLPYRTISGWDVIDQGMGTTNIFPTLLLQNGAQMYRDDYKSVALLEPKAIESFEKWVRMYTDYGFELEFDFYNRFRTGEMPIGIASYGLFNQLSVAAPEIKNLWEMVPIPGMIDETTGEINRKTAGSGTASVILKDSKHYDEAWEFLKWWTNDETQFEYARQMEIILGTAARHSTANVNAFKSLPWTEREKQNLMAQWNNVYEIEEIPGGYYTSRGIDNAFRSAVISKRNYRESLYKWVKEIDNEIIRKREEFGLD